VEIDWRWIFLVNVPVGLAAVVATRRFVPDSRDPVASRTPDLLGAAVLALGVGAAALALVKGPEWGWGSARDSAAFAVAAGGVAAFWLRSVAHPVPVVEPALLRVRAFAWANAAALLFATTFAAGLIGMVLWLQEVWHYSALETGLAILPGPLAVQVVAAATQRVARTVAPGILAAIGCALFAVGTAIVATSVGAHPSYLSDVFPGWLVGGVGVGFALPTIISAATVDLPPARSATGSAVVTMSRQIGFVLGVSVFLGVLDHPHGFLQTHAAFVDGWRVTVAVALAAAVASLGMTPRRGR
jgi:hypothetical protein